MLQSTDINGQSPNIQPYTAVDVSGTTTYYGTSISFNNGSAAIWRIKKEWKVGNVTYTAYPNGEQEFKFIWNNRTGYTYS